MSEFDPLEPITFDTTVSEDEGDQPIAVAVAALLWVLALVLLVCSPAVVIAVWGWLL